jgi:NAD(P)-dependent dehydrogenase (short-subunit alcohol dehydrogenase family)
LAEALGDEGAALVLTATTVEHIAPVAESLGAEALALDLRDSESIQSAASAAARLGRVDVLVNNAGLLGVRAPLSDYPMDVWRDVMSVSVDGTLEFTQALLPSVADGGAIINVTSGAAGRPSWGAYGVSRLAINGLTQMLRAELVDRDIRCVAINPGGVRTEMRAAAYPDEDPLTVPDPKERLEPFVAVAAGEDPGWFVEAKDWSS